MPSEIAIVEVRTEADADAVRSLAMAFVGWLRDRYPEMQAELDVYFESQDFTAGLDGLLTVFNPPEGECLLASVDGRPVGIVMLKRLDDALCEMNRMYVADEARGLGVGRQLCDRLIDRAKELGYRTMFLTALNRHDEALALYRSLGFVDDDIVTPSLDSELVMSLKLE